MPSPMMNAAYFMVNTLFDIYIFILILRIILQYSRASVHNPVVGFVLKLTRAPLRYLQLVLHSFKGINVAALVLVLLLTFIKLCILFITSLNCFSVEASISGISCTHITDLAINV